MGTLLLKSPHSDTKMPIAFDMESRLLSQKQDLEAKYARILADPPTIHRAEVFASLMDSLNQVDRGILALERADRERQQARDPVDWNSEINHYAEGHRQFLIRQFEELTGKKIKNVR
jgi:hypothetical protein